MDNGIEWLFVATSKIRGYEQVWLMRSSRIALDPDTIILSRIVLRGLEKVACMCRRRKLMSLRQGGA